MAVGHTYCESSFCEFWFGFWGVPSVVRYELFCLLVRMELLFLGHSHLLSHHFLPPGTTKGKFLTLLARNKARRLSFGRRKEMAGGDGRRDMQRKEV